MSYQKAQRYLESFINYEFSLGQLSSKDFSLSRIKKLLCLLGVPEAGMKVIHIAGSNGKGMVASLTASILKEAGYKVGLYTSPHINDLRERIRLLDKNAGAQLDGCIFGDAITREDICIMVDKLHSAVSGLCLEEGEDRPTFFEVYTGLALSYFYLKGVDFVVLETGLGGRLDATNAVSSMVAAITPISMEHAGILGETLNEIAYEKAAIIKDSQQAVVVCPQEPEAMKVIISRCSKFGIKPLVVGRDMKYDVLSAGIDGTVFNLINAQGNKAYASVRLSVPGIHQVANAASAVGIIEQVRQTGMVIDDEAVYNGILSLSWPCRFELISNKPCLILDGGHNKAAAEALADTVIAVLPGRRVTLVLGLSSDKDKFGIAGELNRVADMVIMTASSHPRAADIKRKEAEAMFPGRAIFYTDNIADALSLAYKKTTPEDVILVTGSFFVAAEARREIYQIKNLSCTIQPG